MEPSGSVAVVTGAGGGLGAVLSARLGAAGAAVLVVDADAVRASAVVDDVVSRGGRGEALAVDLTDIGSAEPVVAAAERLGGPHVLVNNAGGWGSAEDQFPDADPADWQAVLALNLVVPMALTQRCLAPMTRLGGGAVVQVSSSAGRDTTSYGCPEYAVAKAGLVRLTTSLTGLAETHGVRVGCVVPGWIGLERAVRERERLPVGERPHLVPPEEVADAVLELVVDETSAGRVVVLDPGEAPRVVDR